MIFNIHYVDWDLNDQGYMYHPIFKGAPLILFDIWYWKDQK